jgi:hypothetical protein
VNETGSISAEADVRPSLSFRERLNLGVWFVFNLNDLIRGVRVLGVDAWPIFRARDSVEILSVYLKTYVMTIRRQGHPGTVRTALPICVNSRSSLADPR